MDYYDNNFAQRAAAVPAGGSIAVRGAAESAGAMRAVAETAGLSFTSAAIDGGCIVMTFNRA